MPGYRLQNWKIVVDELKTYSFTTNLARKSFSFRSLIFAQNKLSFLVFSIWFHWNAMHLRQIASSWVRFVTSDPLLFDQISLIAASQSHYAFYKVSNVRHIYLKSYEREKLSIVIFVVATKTSSWVCFVATNPLFFAKLIYWCTSCVWMSLTLLSSVFFCVHVFCYGEFREVSFQFLYLQKMDMGNWYSCYSEFISTWTYHK